METIKVVVKNEKKEFDLSLRKYITKVNDTEYQREPQVDIKNLKDNVDTTAIYNHTKTPVTVKRNDLITYTIRVYNEGEVSGYVNKVTDYLPEELEFVTDNEINKGVWLGCKFRWKKSYYRLFIKRKRCKWK